jgi:hypothetical protein
MLLLATGRRLTVREAFPDRFGTTTGPVAENLANNAPQACSLTEDHFIRSVVTNGFKIDWIREPCLPKKGARDTFVR